MPPGRCVCLVRPDGRRSLVANIGAAGRFDLDYLLNNEDLQRLLDEANVVHLEGFFLTGGRANVCRYVVDEVRPTRRKPVSYNLAAEYIIKEMPAESARMAEGADFVFGNVGEYVALAESARYSGVLGAKECALELHYMWCNTPQREQPLTPYGKLIVVTDGPRTVTVVWGTSSERLQSIHRDAVRVASESVVDTTGAGDAFFAAFMWGILKEQPVEVCVDFACEFAAKFITYVGIRPPDDVHLPRLEDFVR